MYASNVTRMVVCVCIAGLMGTGCVAATKHEHLKKEMANLQDDLMSAENALANAEDYILELESRGENADQWRQQYEDAQARYEAVSAQLSEMESTGYLPNVPGADTIYTPSEGTMGYSMAGDLTFNSGSADLTKRGKEILKEVAAQLKSHDGMIRIDGHTDTDPINKTKDKWPLGNIQLGAGRAIAVQKFLVSQGIPEERIFIASYGPHKPAAEGRTASAKAKNRRVEVLMVLTPSLG